MFTGCSDLYHKLSLSALVVFLDSFCFPLFSSWSCFYLPLEFLSLNYILVFTHVSMASRTTSPGSFSCSPNRLDIAASNLCPEPLRIPLSKSKWCPKAVVQYDPTSTQLGHSSPQEYDASHTKPSPTSISPRFRNSTSRLGTLVSKFEILDAVNNAHPAVSRIPRLSTKKEEVLSGTAITSPLRQVAPTPRRVPPQYSSSTGNSRIFDGFGQSPQERVQTIRKSTRSSQLPITSCFKAPVLDELPQTPKSQQSPLPQKYNTRDTTDLLPLVAVIPPEAKATG
jgi:hypothetical protein